MTLFWSCNPLNAEEKFENSPTLFKPSLVCRYYPFLIFSFFIGVSSDHKKMLSNAWKWYQKCLTVHPVKTQIISSGVLWGIGDVTAQTITHYSTVKNKHPQNHVRRRRIPLFGIWFYQYLPLILPFFWVMGILLFYFLWVSCFDLQILDQGTSINILVWFFWLMGVCSFSL